MKKIIILFIMIFLLMLSGTALYSNNPLELRELAKPEMMTTDGNKLYILDGIEVYIYSMNDYTLLGKIGKQGDGPGEFKTTFVDRLKLQLDNGNILLNNMNKMARFSSDGTLIREKRFPFIVMQIVPVENHFAVTRFLPGANGVNQLAVQLMDDQLVKIKTLYTREEISFRKSGKLDCPNEQIFVRYAWDRLYIVDQIDKTLHIRVFDRRGNPLPAIKKDDPPMKMPESYKEEVLAWADAQQSQIRPHADRLRISMDQMKQMIYYHPVLPAARYFTTNSDTFIVQTYLKKEDRSQFIFLDKEGKTSAKVYLTDAEPGRVKMSPTATYTFYKNRYLFLMENPDTETWELHAEIF